MYKYTLKKHWLHYYKSIGPYNRYVPYENQKDFIDSGWPTEYVCRSFAMSKAADVVFFSKTKLRFVPVYGYLIPVHFFNEDLVLDSGIQS